MAPKSKTKKSRGSDSLIDDDNENTVARKNRMQRKRVQADPRISRLIERANKITIPQHLQDELKLMFITSKNMQTGEYTYMGVSPSFDNPTKNAKKLANVFLTIQAYTDRVLTIQMQLEDIGNTLTSYKRKCVEYIHESYSDILKSRGPLTTQAVFIESVIEDIIEKRELVEMLATRCDKIVKNLSATHFSFSKLHTSGESYLNRSEGTRGQYRA